MLLLRLGGRVRPFIDQREATLKLELNALNLARYDEYSPVPLNFRVSSGTLDSDIELSFLQPLEGEPRVTLRGTLELRDLDLVDRDGRALIKLPALDVVLNEIEPLAGKVDIASIRVDQPDFEVARARDGSLNLKALLPAPARRRCPGVSGRTGARSCDRFGRPRHPRRAARGTAGAHCDQ
jgi:hypothetical protein